MATQHKVSEHKNIVNESPENKTSNKTSNAIDFNIFESDKECKGADSDISECQCINRVVYAMKYYTALNTKRSKEGKETFTHFLKELYPNYINDSIHIQTAHDSQLQEINELLFTKYGFKQCSVSSCVLTERHCRINERKESNANNNEIFSFYESAFDSMHYYLMHLFDFGLRCKKSESDKPEIKEEKQENLLKCFDAEFARKKRAIHDKRKHLSQFFERFETENNKFNLKTGFAKKEKNQSNESTFLDDLCSQKLIQKVPMFQLFLKSEEFDTDAVLDDIDTYVIDNWSSNICKETKNVNLMQQIIKYIRHQKLQNMSFSTGFVFWYWPYYAPTQTDAKNEKSRVISSFVNENDLDGYSTAELYIKAGKYDTFKEEILAYSDGKNGGITMKIYQTKILFKATEYMQTKRVKSIRAKKPDSDAPREYGIAKDEPIRQSHIMSAIIYCDFTGLSTEFSATFRRLHALESLKAVKNRNKVYYWMSKRLREAVEIYGQCGEGDTYWRGENKELGPFFCGMSSVMVMPSFSIRLNGPTSTSKHIEISMNFAKNTDIIIQLNNKYGVSLGQRFLNVSWLSSFKEESERITIGGSFQLQIQTIRNTKTLQNYKLYFKPLYYFDAVLSGTWLVAISGLLNDKGIGIISSLIQYSIGTNPINIEYDPYVLDTFDMLCLKKKTLTFNMEFINDGCEKQKMRNLLFDSLVRKEKDKGNTEYSDDKSNTNILRSDLLNLFSNLEKIIIYATHQDGQDSYPFSIFALLDLLSSLETVKNGNKIKCVIYGVWKERFQEDGKRSWIFYQYTSPIKSDLFSLSLTKTQNIDGYWNDVLTIQTL